MTKKRPQLPAPPPATCGNRDRLLQQSEAPASCKDPDKFVVRQGPVYGKSTCVAEDPCTNEDGLVTKGTEAETVSPVSTAANSPVKKTSAVETQPKGASGDPWGFQGPADHRGRIFSQQPIGILKNENLTFCFPGAPVQLRKHPARVYKHCLLYTSPSPRDRQTSRIPGCA